MAAPITETFDGISLSDDSDGDNNRSFGDSPRAINDWTIRLLDSGGLDAPGDGGAPSHLDVTGFAGDSVLVGAGDNALSVHGHLNIATEARFSATTGEEFWLQSFSLENADMGENVRVLGYRNGVQVASQDFTAALGGVDTLVTLDQGADQDWQNIDEFRIVQQNGSADIYFFIDDITVADAVLPNVAPVIDNLDGDGASFLEGGIAVLLDAGGDATVSDADSADFDGGSIIVAITADGTPGEDVLSVQNEGSALGQVGVSGSDVSYGGVKVGEMTGGTGISDLVISLNGQATANAVQAILRKLIYSNTNTLDPSTLIREVKITVNDGDGGSTIQTVTMDVVSINDAPTATNLTQTVTYTEDPGSSVALGDIVVTEVDAGDEITATFTLSSPAAGSLGTGAFGSATSTYNAGTGVWTVTGSAADVNAALAAVAFTPSANWDQDVTIATRIRDAANTGPADGAITLDVTPVNDAPTVTMPFSINVTEDVLTALTGISFADVDAGGGTMTATFSIGSGRLTGDSGAGVAVTGSGTGSLTLSGSIADINAFIAASQLSFQTALNSTSNVVLTVRIDDNGNTGSGGDEFYAAALILDVTEVNDAPVVSVPSIISVTEDVASSVTGISFSDADAGGSSVTATLSVGSGTLAGASGGGVTVGGTSSALTLTGTIANINAFISASNVTFTTAANATSDVTLTAGINDGGNTGSGGAQTDSDTVTLQVTPVNDAPTAANLTQTVTYTEDPGGSVALGDIVVTDVEAGDTITATLTLSNSAAGSLGTGAFGSATSTYNAGTGVWTVAGSVADVNAALAAVAFTPSANWDQDVTIATRIRDAANTGPADGTITLDVAPVNDAPVNSTPAAQAVDQDATLVFNSANGNLISISDVDAGGDDILMMLDASDGLITLSGTTGLRFLGGTGANGDLIHFTGTIADINAALDGMSFAPTPGYNGAASLRIITHDGGGSGSGGAQMDTDTIAITVNELNPKVTSVNVTNPDALYKEGDVIYVTVTFDQAVTVAGGIPSLMLETGSTDRLATYVSGDGTGTLTFSYTVQAGDLSADLDYQSTGALALNGGTIRSATNLDAVLTLPATGGAYSIAGQHGIMVDGVAPTVGSVSVPADGTYVASQNLDFTVNLSEAVIVDTTGGTPRLAITIGSGTVYANYISGSGTGALLFRLTVSAGQQDLDGIQINAIDRNGGTLRDAAGNSAVMTLNSVGSTVGVLVNTATLDITGTFEAAANGSSAGTLTAAGGSSYTFSLVSGTGDDDNANFSIDSAGNVSVVNGLLLDYEQKNTFSIRVHVESGGLTVEKVLTGSVGDVNPENVTGDGDPNVFVGGALDDRLSGTGGNDTLSGGDGNDLLNGGTGNDHMIGGAGNDIFVVDSTGDSTIEAGAGGTDTVRAFVNWTLGANVERLELQGSGNLSGAGNALNNTLVGTSGDNLLNGGAGNDYMVGGAGNDIFVVDASGDRTIEAANGGIDTVRSFVNWTLADNVERLELQGSGDLNGTGNALNNTLVGTSGDNLLNGGAGNDYMVGGAGNDIFIVAANGDQTIEAANGGTDTVRSYINWTLADNVERLELQGSGNLNGTGNALNNTLVGNAGRNLLNGGAGNDYMVGGAGNDIFVVDASGDQVIEAANGGIDTVRSYIDWSLADNVERLELFGSALNSTGNALNNTLVGRAGANVFDGDDGDDYLTAGAGNDTLYGGGGSDRLVGGAGADILFGGAGNDFFRYEAVTDGLVGPGMRDTIMDFTHGEDKISLHALRDDIGNQAFSFIGTAAFSGVAGEFRYTNYGGNVIIDADVNGDSTADMQILVAGATYMTGTDFIL
jgi:Ca2+-binding RTX toxin-like protein